VRITFAFFPTLVFGVVIACWFVFASLFLLRKKPPSPPDQKRDPASLVGVVLQAISYAVVWGGHRAPFTPISSSIGLIATVFGVLAIVAAIGSVWVVYLALKTLGKEWSITARLVEDHKLATSGPYAYVRHPIYTGMLGMLIATGIAVSHWIALLAALLIFFIGTTIRVRSEDRLLRGAFGEQFENYANRVSAIVPGLF
jgi:protein-S-isoprenylcysteine O-methyltransferase Ste14